MGLQGAPEASADPQEAPRVGQKIEKFPKKIREGEKKGEILAAGAVNTQAVSCRTFTTPKIQNWPYAPVFGFYSPKTLSVVITKLDPPQETLRTSCY